MLRILNALLLIVTLIGAFFSVRAGLEYQQLRAEHRTLMAEVGLLHVRDTNKVHFGAIDTGEPLHFAWQVYVPANYHKQWKTRLRRGGSGSSGGSNSEAYYDIVRLRVRKDDNGRGTIWKKHRNGSLMFGIDNRDLALFEQSQVDIEQLGTKGTAVVEPDQVVTLLRVSDPSTPDEKPLVEIRFGTPQAFQNELAE